MIQTLPLKRNYKLLNLELYNVVPRIGTRSESMPASFGKIAKSGHPDPKTDVAFFTYEKTLRIDPTF